MPDSNKRYRSTPLEAFLVVIALFLTVFIVGATGWTFGVQAGRDQVSAREHYDQEKKDRLESCVGRDGPALSECVAEAVESAHDQSVSRQDLYAQQDMAEYTFFVLIVSALTLAVTCAGVWFVKRTLDATLGAVEETGRATEAMHEANQILREEQRPYLLLNTREVELSVIPGMVRLRARMKNYGPTPAFYPNIAINHKFTTRKSAGKSEFWQTPLRRFDKDNAAVIGPGENYTGVWLDLSNGAQVFDDPENFPVHVYVDVVFTYKNHAGKVFPAEFFRVDCSVARAREFTRCGALRLECDPQGAGDIYPY